MNKLIYVERPNYETNGKTLIKAENIVIIKKKYFQLNSQRNERNQIKINVTYLGLVK